MKKNETKMNNKGFSLVELIVVIAIMAVLVGVLAPQFMKYVERSREGTDIQNVDNVATALKTYFVEIENINADISVTIQKAGLVTTGLDANAKTAIEEAGLKDVKLRGTWTDDKIVITYKHDTGQTVFTGSAKHYHTDTSGAFVPGPATTP